MVYYRSLRRPMAPTKGSHCSFLRLFPLLLNAQTVPSLSYNELKPLLNQKGDKIYVVNFWATWCAPCIKELPYFEVLNQREDVQVLLVSLDFPKHK